MKCFKLFSLLLIFSFFATQFAVAQDKKDFTGTWLVEDEDAKVKLIINKRGELEGEVVWYIDPNAKDVDNRDPALRDRPVVGLKVVWGFEWDDRRREWVNGRVYNEGREYCGRIRMNGEDELFLRGSICRTPFGRTNTWKRVD